MNEQLNDAYKALAAAVVIQAARDAVRGDPMAIYWLKNDGLVWCEGLGIDLLPAKIDTFLLRRKKKFAARTKQGPHKRQAAGVMI